MQRDPGITPVRDRPRSLDTARVVRAGAMAGTRPTGATHRRARGRRSRKKEHHLEPVTTPLKLRIVIASTPPGRREPAIREWIRSRAVTHGGFAVEILDLAEFDLPFMDEPYHPRLRQYQHQHTRDWSAAVDGADAFVFVTPSTTTA